VKWPPEIGPLAWLETGLLHYGDGARDVEAEEASD
jgi:hypothetical protein